ncbi:MAG: class II fructose-bisphosphate aldolase family protein [Actinomycetota bacterium]|nr:class II fructose-bisphosphate aldolase family protein [Actinomycetota bacterium]
MSLINLKNLLGHAKSNKYAVGAFAMTNIDFIEALLESAIEKKSPIILLLAEVHFKYLDIERVAPIIIDRARSANIPVCVSLDHGLNFKTIVKAIRCGFNSVMFDGSKFPLKENISQTKEITRIAHAVDVSVEAELGYVGGESVGEKAPESHTPDKNLFTNVKDAKRFYEETGIDALAVAVGNVHGIYKGEPKLDFELLKELSDTLPIPLVLHGGSGISDDDYKKSIELGICKINYYTGMTMAAVKRMRAYLTENPDVNSYPDIIKTSMLAIMEDVKERLDVFGSTGKCDSSDSLCLSCDDRSCGINIRDNNHSSSGTISYKDLIKTISDKVSNNILNLSNK